jgi:hypothetical protein
MVPTPSSLTSSLSPGNKGMPKQECGTRPRLLELQRRANRLAKSREKRLPAYGRELKRTEGPGQSQPLALNLEIADN